MEKYIQSIIDEYRYKKLEPVDKKFTAQEILNKHRSQTAYKNTLNHSYTESKLNRFNFSQKSVIDFKQTQSSTKQQKRQSQSHKKDQNKYIQYNNFIQIQIYEKGKGKQKEKEKEKEKSKEKAKGVRKDDNLVEKSGFIQFKQDKSNKISFILNKNMPLKKNRKLGSLQTDKVYPQIGFPIDIKELNRLKEQSKMRNNQIIEQKVDDQKQMKCTNQFSQKHLDQSKQNYEEQFETINTEQSNQQIQVQFQNQQKIHQYNFSIQDNEQSELQSSKQQVESSFGKGNQNKSISIEMGTECSRSQDQNVLESCKREQISRKWDIEDFEILQKLGQGRFGKVFLARCRRSGFMVALKVVEQKVLEETEMYSQLAREIMIHSYLKHPNIVQMYGWFRDQYNVYLVLEHCEGSELFRLLQSQPEKRFSELEVANYINQLASSLKYLEKQKVIHRDIKPENILISNGVVKLTDFGWSVYNKNLFNIRSTFCGTADYVSPEMLGDSYYNYKIDTWSLGVLTFELLVGNPPFSQNQEQDYDSIFSNIKMFSDGYSGIQFPSFLSDESIGFMKEILQRNPHKRPNLDNIVNSRWVRQQLKTNENQKEIEKYMQQLL